MTTMKSTKVQKCASLTATITADLEKAFAENECAFDIASHQVIHHSGARKEDRVFEIASRVALYYAEQLRWSNYHVWSFYRHKTAEEMRAMPPELWNKIYPFGTCLGLASYIIETLQ